MIAKTLGYDVIEAEKGRVVVSVEPNEGHLNPYGSVHGGLTATLLDCCMGLAIRASGRPRSSSRFHSSGPITPDTGPITAEGIVLNAGRCVGTAEGRLTDSRGRLLAHGTLARLIFETR
jgi:uncharacterized protein (TIGR00369 family)